MHRGYKIRVLAALWGTWDERNSWQVNVDEKNSALGKFWYCQGFQEEISDFCRSLVYKT